jgi:hypothetical protein
MTNHTPLRCAYSGMASFSKGGDGYILLLNSGNYPSFSSYGNETWIWNWTNGNEDWTNISSAFINTNAPLGPSAGSPPVVMSARINEVIAPDSNGNVMVYGGQGSSSLAGVFQDTWTFSPTTATWTLQSPATVPYGRTQAVGAYLSGTGTVMFGGCLANGQILLETWIWNGTTWSQVSVANGAGPAGRVGHVMAASSSAVLLFGGVGTSSNLFNDTWSFNGTTWTQLGVTGPSVRTGACMAYDSHNSVWVLFSGQNDSTWLNDTWTFNGTTWTQVSVANGAGPAARIGAQMAFDTQNNLTIMYGGISASTMYPSNSTWAFNGATSQWLQLG